MDTDISQLESLLAEKKYDEARAIIQKAVSARMTASEKGGALVEVASAYMDIMNAINSRYRDALEEAIESMQMLNRSESKINDKIRIDEIKASLGAK